MAGSGTSSRPFLICRYASLKRESLRSGPECHPVVTSRPVTNAGISDLGNGVPRLPFVSAVDGNCPEMLFRELLGGILPTNHDECAFAELVMVVEVRRMCDRLH